MKKIFILLTIIMMIFGAASPSLANTNTSQPTDSLKGMQELNENQQASVAKHLQELRAELASNKKELSKEHKKLANKALKDYKKTLTYATILEGDEVVMLSTDQANVQVSITGNRIDVVERIDMETYIINGERHEFEFTVTDEDGAVVTAQPSGEIGTMADEDGAAVTAQPSDEIGTMAYDGNWYSSGYKSGPWTVEYAGRWVDINAQRNFSTYSASTLGGIIGGIIGASFVWPVTGSLALGAGVAAAYSYVAASEYPTNVGRSFVTTYRNGTYPTSDRRIRSSDHAMYYGTAKYLGEKYTYYIRCIACGVG